MTRRNNQTRIDERPRAVVLVLGPLDHSPRMLNHALSLAEAGWNVTFAGYPWESPIDEIDQNPRVEVSFIVDRVSDRPSYLIRSAIRFVRLGFLVTRKLLWCKNQLIVVQTPPALPTLPAVLLSRGLRRFLGKGRSRIVIDWHNLGYTRFAERAGSTSFATWLYRRLEGTFGKRGDGFLCVSERMQKRLTDEFGLQEVRVLYDRPTKRNMTQSRNETRLCYLQRVFPELNLSEDPTRLFVCPTSWTDDEDTDALATVIERLESEAPAGTPVSSLIVLTGRGPNQASFEARLEGAGSTRTLVCTRWLEISDYHRILRYADFGICLHRSSSGVDLPMKLADMLGANLPVLTYNYGSTLEERFSEGQDGFFFRTEHDLFKHLFALLQDPVPLRYRMLSEASANRDPESWESGWEREALSVMKG